MAPKATFKGKKGKGKVGKAGKAVGPSLFIERQENLQSLSERSALLERQQALQEERQQFLDGGEERVVAKRERVLSLTEQALKKRENQPDEWKVLDPRVTKAVPSVNDKWRLVGLFLEAKGLISCQLESFDFFVTQGISDILKSNQEIRCDIDPDWFMKYDRIYVGRPCVPNEKNFQNDILTPQDCRLRDLSYMASIFVDYHYYVGNKSWKSVKKLEIGKLPIMLRSRLCHLRNADEEKMQQMNECPLDPGGYFIIAGTEKVFSRRKEYPVKNEIP